MSRFVLALVMVVLMAIPARADFGYNERCATTYNRYYCAWVSAPSVRFNERVTAYGRWLRDGKPVTHRYFVAVNTVTGREYCYGFTNSQGIGQCSFVADVPGGMGFHILADGEAGERTWVDVVANRQVWLPVVGR